MHPRLLTVPAFDLLGRSFGPFTLHTYGVLLAIAFLAGLWVASRQAKRAGLDANRITDMAVWVLIAGLVGAKLLLVAVDWRYFGRNPRELFSIFQSGGVFYGGLVAGILVAAYRNAGGDATQAEIDTAIHRADTIPGGFCAGFGADAAAIACGIAVSVIEGATVKAEHAVARSLAHMLTGQGLLLIANHHGNRCCKRSVFTVLELAAHFFTATMGVAFAPPRGRVECAFSAQNKLCNEADCKFYPAVPPVKVEPRLVVVG